MRSAEIKVTTSMEENLFTLCSEDKVKITTATGETIIIEMDPFYKLD